MRDLVADLVALFRLQGGRLAVEPQPVSVGEIARRLATSESVCKGERRDRLDLEIAAEATISTDPDRLEQLLERLLRHALLAAEGGQVTVRVAEGADGSVEIQIRYGGAPVPADDRCELFLPFSSASTRERRRIGDAGLSLPLAAQLVDLLGGALAYENSAEVNLLRLCLPPATPPGSPTTSCD